MKFYQSCHLSDVGSTFATKSARAGVFDAAASQSATEDLLMTIAKGDPEASPALQPWQGIHGGGDKSSNWREAGLLAPVNGGLWRKRHV